MRGIDVITPVVQQGAQERVECGVTAPKDDRGSHVRGYAEAVHAVTRKRCILSFSEVPISSLMESVTARELPWEESGKRELNRRPGNKCYPFAGAAIIEGGTAVRGPRPPVHPGEILREEFMRPLDLSGYALAKACRVPRTRIERLAREETPVTADTALRLGRYFGTGAEFWMNLQTAFDLVIADDKSIRTITPRKAA